MNQNEETSYQNLWDAVKTAIGGKLIVADNHNEKEERSQTKNLTSHIKNQKKQIIYTERRKEIINLRVQKN